MARVPESHRRRAGFTVLELLIVLGLVLALFGLTLPFMIDGLDRRRAAALRDDVSSMVSLARSMARRDGIAIELVWTTTPGRLEARRFDPSPGGFRTTSDDRWSEIDPPEDDRLLRAAWARLEPEDGVRLAPPIDPSTSDRSPIDGAGDFLDGVGADPSATSWSAETRLLVILPDGTVVRLEPFMVGEPDRELVCEVDPLTGRVVWRDPFETASSREGPEDQPEDEMEGEADPEPDSDSTPGPDAGPEVGDDPTPIDAISSADPEVAR